MNCRKVQSLISAYVDSELPGIEMLAVRQHLSGCAECRLEFESLLTIKRVFGSLRPQRPAPDLASRICERLDEVYHPHHEQVFALLRKHLTIFPGKLRLAAVGVAVFALLLMVRSGEISRSSYAYIPLSPPTQVSSLAGLSPVALPPALPVGESASFSTVPSSETPAQTWRPVEYREEPLRLPGSPGLSLTTYTVPR